MVSSEEVVARIKSYLERYPTSRILTNLGLSQEDLEVMSDPASQQSQLAALQQVVLDLAQQVSALTTAQASAQAGSSAATAPSGNAQLPNSNWTRDVAKFNGDGYEAAREFVRNANGVLVYVPPAVDSHTVAVMLSNKLTGPASVWYEQYQLQNPNHTLEQFLGAFKQRYIGGRKAQTSLRDDFYDVAKYPRSLEESYKRMTEILSNLEDPPKEIDKIATLRKIIREPTIRLELDRAEPSTLEEAYTAAVNAATAVKSARGSAPDHGSRPQPRSQSSQRPGRGNSRPNTRSQRNSFAPQTQFTPRPQFNHMHTQATAMHTAHTAPHVHAATVMTPAAATFHGQSQTMYAPPVPVMPDATVHAPNMYHEEYPRIARLDEQEHRRCQEQNLCFRCRQPGHWASQCPNSDQPPPANAGRGNFRNGDARRR